ncbi:MAG TPA: glutamine-hydrolyzing carbamoyl-phosphate synthase small subunit [Chitinophagaceae bacterium]|nr:glutamine-hydrolyzing carbamoyl-phosphate synthase small subunit [Chitinophagaceae bacterium]
MNTSQKAVLLLADGTYFEGLAFGFIGTCTGEVCFNTGMTGYQEVFTDPSYFGQVLIMNTAHVGNYGTTPKDAESDSVKISGLICKNLSTKYSRIQGTQNLEEYLIQHKIVAIHGIDTRSLVEHVRIVGAMNCIISSVTTDVAELTSLLAEVPSMDGLELASKVTTTAPYEIGNENNFPRVAVLDFGVKQHILKCLAARNLHLKVFPANTSFEECEAFAPHAYFLSNGPGDPASMDYAIDTVEKIIASGKPTFGICLGHQLIALANGATTYKMHYGHRGLNHPVYNHLTGKSEVTSQNHGFAVAHDSVTALSNLEITHTNLNDDTLEGIRMKDKPCFSVQYHPEAGPGPHDADYLFDEFAKMIQV